MPNWSDIERPVLRCTCLNEIIQYIHLTIPPSPFSIASKPSFLPRSTIIHPNSSTYNYAISTTDYFTSSFLFPTFTRSLPPPLLLLFLLLPPPEQQPIEMPLILARVSKTYLAESSSPMRSWYLSCWDSMWIYLPSHQHVFRSTYQVISSVPLRERELFQHQSWKKASINLCGDCSLRWSPHRTKVPTYLPG